MKRKIKVFLLSAVITTILLLVIFLIGESGLTSSTPFVIENTSPCYSSSNIDTRGPSYFFPSADVSVSLTNPYAKYIENLTVYYSINNSTWVQVPFSDTPNYTRIGTVPLDSFSIPVYLKVSFQIQDVEMQNQTVPFVTVLRNFHNDIAFTPLISSQTWVIFILLGIATFSFVLQILDFLTKDDKESLIKKEKKNTTYKR
ncbi:MAG: hypothetical protein ABR962_10620 [Candidatus Bathyarchaeia archaeon]|jgi:hypothetical protein